MKKTKNKAADQKKDKNSPDSPDKIFIGVSWPYASGNIHIGHLAGQYVVCDVFGRYHRLKGNKVLMVSGSDCHGAPVAFRAEERGIKPEELAKESHEKIKESYEKLGFLYENYTSTMTENHKQVVQNLFSALEEFGYLKAKKSRQYYDPEVERFLPDRYVRGTCPECGATNARGDECPECGEYLSPEDLIDPYSTLSDATPVIKGTEHFYLDLTKAEKSISKWVSKQNHWRKWVKEFTKGWLKMGLEPRAVTRDFDYGIPVPVEGWDDKVIYVWFEAVIGYLSAAVEWAARQGDTAAWEEFWKNSNCKHYYFIAGGNVPFHTIIWPAELIAYNQKYEDEKLMKKYLLPGEKSREDLNLPYDVPANKMLTYKGKKMSKGDKTGIGLEKLLEDYHPDVIRYFFVKYAPENHDREYKWQDFIDANNNELVANLGNFINRVLTFTQSRFENTVPAGTMSSEVAKEIKKAFKKTGQHIEKAEFVKAIESVHELGHFANRYFNDEKPWETVKEDKDKAAATIYNSIQIISAIQTLLKPFLPFSAETLRKMLNLPENYDANKELNEIGKVTKFIDTWNFNEIKVGHELNEAEILFKKLEYTDELQKADAAEHDELIISDEELDIDLSEVDENIVIGKILEIKDHPNADRLRIATVTINSKNTLEIICGADNIKKGQVVPVATSGSKVLDDKGQQVKIKRTKIKDIASQGMLCSPAELGVGDNNEEILIFPDALAKETGKPVENIRFVKLLRQNDIENLPTNWAVLPDINIKKNRSSSLDKWIKQVEQEIKDKYSNNKDLRKDPIHKAYRDLHSKYGHDNMPGSPEDMIRFIVEKGSLPNINNIVDLYNAFSAKTGISIGAHDIKKLSGLPKLKILEKDRDFRHATTNEKGKAYEGEFAYIDKKGILCRLDIKQGNRTKVSQDTSDVLIIFQGNGNINQEIVDKQLERFKQLIEELINKSEN